MRACLYIPVSLRERERLGERENTTRRCQCAVDLCVLERTCMYVFVDVRMYVCPYVCHGMCVCVCARVCVCVCVPVPVYHCAPQSRAQS